MSLHPGYTIENGCMMFPDPIERLDAEVVNGVVTLLVTTSRGVTRVPAGSVPTMKRRPMLIHPRKDPPLHFLIHPKPTDDFDSMEW